MNDFRVHGYQQGVNTWEILRFVLIECNRVDDPAGFYACLRCQILSTSLHCKSLSPADGKCIILASFDSEIHNDVSSVPVRSLVHLHHQCALDNRMPWQASNAHVWLLLLWQDRRSPLDGLQRVTYFRYAPTRTEPAPHAFLELVLT